VEIAVIGAGIAGLTAAYLLRNRKIRVLEAAPTPGGRTLAGRHGPFHYAKGTEYLGPPEGVLKALVDELGLKAVEILDPMDALFYDKKLYYGEDGLALLSIQKSSLAAYNRFVAAMQAAENGYEDLPDYNLQNPLAWMDEITAADWFEKLGAADIFRERYNVAARGLFGANLKEISALSVIPEFAFDYEDTEPVEDISDLENTSALTGYPTGSFTFPGGISDVTEALAAALGAALTLNAPVQAITPDETGGYLIRYGENQTLKAGQVILAIPAPLALAVAKDALQPEQAGLLAQIPYAQYITCALFSDEPLFNRAFDLALPDGRFLTDLYDSTWVQRHLDPGLKNEPSYIATAYIASASFRDTALTDLSDDEILARLFADLEDVIPGIQEKVTGHDIQRFPYAYPVLVPGAYARMIRLNELNQRGGVVLAGDYLIYPTFEAAAETGGLAAKIVQAR
jgi:protoporphyrinogen oxidase